MRRVVVVTWKNSSKQGVEIFSNLKIFCEIYPGYSYNTLNNYLSKAKVAYENDVIRIERIFVRSQPVSERQISIVAKRVNMRTHDEQATDTAFWLSRPVIERLEAVTRLSGMLKKRKNERMNRMHVVKRKL